MKKVALSICFAWCLAFAPAVHAIGFEFALGAWNQTPSGDLSYKSTSGNDTLDVEDDLDYDSQWRFNGRLKLDMPLLIPNVYLMATPMSFDGTGSKATDFKFGDITFAANTKFTSKVTLDHYDVALYYGIPFVSLATANMLNVDAGVNLRYVDFKAEVSQGGISESQSLSLPIPMAFLAAQLTPLESLALEAELRAIAYSGNSYYSLIGRVKYKAFGPLFAAGGYRWDRINVDEDDVDLEVTLGGFFFEVGCQF